MSINFLDVRESVDLQETIERYLGPPARSGSTWFCPFHNDVTNPNLTIKDGFYRCWSSQCGAHGDVTDFVAKMEQIAQAEAARQLAGHVINLGLSQAEIAEHRLKLKQERAAKQAEIAEQALDKLSKLDKLILHYHNNLLKSQEHIDLLAQDGIDLAMIETHKLGFCHNCPTHYEDVASLTFPYWQSGSLVACTHRILGSDSDKYRPQIKGQPKALFNIDSLKRAFESDPFFSLLEPAQALVVEGEKKAIYLSERFSFPVVGLPGAQTWQASFASHFAGIERLYLVLDPGVETGVYEQISADLQGIECRRARILHKPDDYFVRYGGTIQDFLSVLAWSKTI